MFAYAPYLSICSAGHQFTVGPGVNIGCCYATALDRIMALGISPSAMDPLRAGKKNCQIDITIDRWFPIFLLFFFFQCSAGTLRFFGCPAYNQYSPTE
jgi:hypothetical protein